MNFSKMIWAAQQDTRYKRGDDALYLDETKQTFNRSSGSYVYTLPYVKHNVCVCMYVFNRVRLVGNSEIQTCLHRSNPLILDLD